jgi:hypothetical protein
MLAPLNGLRPNAHPPEWSRPGFPAGFPSIYGVKKESKVPSVSVALNLSGARNTSKSCESCQDKKDFALIRQRANEALAIVAPTAARTPSLSK